jgi:hypothetical protein
MNVARHRASSVLIAISVASRHLTWSPTSEVGIQVKGIMWWLSTMNKWTFLCVKVLRINQHQPLELIMACDEQAIDNHSGNHTCVRSKYIQLWYITLWLYTNCEHLEFPLNKSHAIFLCVILKKERKCILFFFFSIFSLTSISFFIDIDWLYFVDRSYLLIVYGHNAVPSCRLSYTSYASYKTIFHASQCDLISL